MTHDQPTQINFCKMIHSQPTQISKVFRFPNMDTLEEWARLEELDGEVHQLLGQLFLNFPTTLDELFDRGTELHDLLDQYPKGHEIWTAAEAFLFLMKFQKYLRDSENPEE